MKHNDHRKGSNSHDFDTPNFNNNRAVNSKGFYTNMRALNSLTEDDDDDDMVEDDMRESHHIGVMGTNRMSQKYKVSQKRELPAL